MQKCLNSNTRRCSNSIKRKITPSISKRDSWSSLYRTSYIKSKKNCWDQDIREDLEAEACRGEGEKKAVRVFETTPGQSLGQEYYATLLRNTEAF